MLSFARKVLHLLEPGERWRLWVLLAAMVVSGLVQTVGIASIMPFLAVVSNPAVVSENAYLARAYDAFGFSSTTTFLIVLGVAFIVAMVASTGFTALTSWMTIRFQWRTHARLSNRLLAGYLRAPYAYYLNENSARLGATLLDQVDPVTRGLFTSTATIVARSISAVFIVSLLVAVEPFLAIVVSLVIVLFYGLIYALVRKKQSAYGEAVVEARTERYRTAAEAFGGIKELKVLGREDHFLKRFLKPSLRYARANSADALVALLPHFALQTVAYGGIVVAVIYLLQTRGSLDQVFPLLAVYAIGANRLIPAAQDIFSSLTKIRFQMPSLDDLHADLRASEAHGQRPPAAANGAASRAAPSEQLQLREGDTIRLDDISFTYPNAARAALERVSLDILINRTSALVGATGSGKTTIVDLVLGLFEPTKGRILVAGRPLDDTLLPQWRQTVGYVPQSIYLCDATIAENIAFGIPPDRVDAAAVRSAAQAAHLDGFVESLPDGYDTMVGERGIRLSGGQRQRIGIARALYHNPAVLVMDEATSALDNVTEDVVMQAIRDLAQKRTILLIAHRLTTVEECDVIHMLDNGRVVASGRYDELVKSSPAFRAMARV